MTRLTARSAPIIICCLVIAGALCGVAPAVGAGSSTQTGTAPQQLVHAYPLGPKRLCCAGKRGSRTGSSASSSGTPGAQPAAGPPPRPARSTKPSAGGTGGSASSDLIWIIPATVAALLLAACIAVMHRTNRRLANALRTAAAPDQPIETPNPANLLAEEEPDRQQPEVDASAKRDRPAVAAATQPAELAYRRADRQGDAEGAFNLGVLLQRRRDSTGAAAAYRRADQRGDRDAAFNLGVLLYETGDLDGAQRAWQRAVQRGNTRAQANLRFLQQRRDQLEAAQPRDDANEPVELAYRRADEEGDADAAFNLGVLLHARRDFSGAAAAYGRAEQRGDPDAAFNLGVLLYDGGDLDGAEAAFRRSAGRGNARAQANLRFLLERRGDLERADHR